MIMWTPSRGPEKADVSTLTNPDQAPQLRRPEMITALSGAPLARNAVRDDRRQPVRQINGTIIQRHRPPRGIVDQCSPVAAGSGCRHPPTDVRTAFKTVSRPREAPATPNDYDTRHGKADSEENKGRMSRPVPPAFPP